MAWYGLPLPCSKIDISHRMSCSHMAEAYCPTIIRILDWVRNIVIFFYRIWNESGLHEEGRTWKAIRLWSRMFWRRRSSSARRLSNPFYPNSLLCFDQRLETRLPIKNYLNIERERVRKKNGQKEENHTAEDAAALIVVIELAVIRPPLRSLRKLFAPHLAGDRNPA